MDRAEDDMKLVGFFGIFTHSFKTIFSRKKLFTQITLSFILPLTIIFFLHLILSRHLFHHIENNTLPYDTNDSRQTTPLEWLYYALFSFTYFIFLTIFSILSTASVVFTVASIYTRRDVTFLNVIKIIPKIWKRLCITSITVYIVQFLYDTLVTIVMAVLRAVFGYTNISLVIMSIILLLFVLGFLYITVVCQLASVATVLENVYGCAAMSKGKVLAKGKKAVGMGIVFILYVILVGLIVVYLLFVEYGDEVFKWALIWRVLIGVLCGILVMMVFLVFIVGQTVLYLVCKSYHREAIDKRSLSTFLGAYTGETEGIQVGRSIGPVEQV